MTQTIVLFLVTGALFGLLTYPYRHRFSEGVSKPGAPQAAGLIDGRVLWVTLCTALWPLMALTGVFNALASRSAKRRKP